MKLKEKVKLLLDNDVIKEVQGTTFKVEGIPLEFVAHESRDGWRDGLCDITEKSTGLRLSDKLNLTVTAITLKQLIEEVNKCIKKHSKKAILDIINSTKKLNERV